jgi:hypothetical protein
MDRNTYQTEITIRPSGHVNWKVSLHYHEVARGISKDLAEAMCTVAQQIEAAIGAEVADEIAEKERQGQEELAKWRAAQEAKKKAEEANVVAPVVAEPSVLQSSAAICSVTDCTQAARSNGHCADHAATAARNGTDAYDTPFMQALSE